MQKLSRASYILLRTHTHTQLYPSAVAPHTSDSSSAFRLYPSLLGTQSWPCTFSHSLSFAAAVTVALEMAAGWKADLALGGRLCGSCLVRMQAVLPGRPF